MVTKRGISLSPEQRKVVGYLIAGLILILFSIKLTVSLIGDRGASFTQDGAPALVFYNVEEPCECMKDLVYRANNQIGLWPVVRSGNIRVVYMNFGEDLELETKHHIFRAPALVLLDKNGKIVWRQDYPLIEGGPFELEELEKAIAEMDTK